MKNCLGAPMWWKPECMPKEKHATMHTTNTSPTTATITTTATYHYHYHCYNHYHFLVLLPQLLLLLHVICMSYEILKESESVGEINLMHRRASPRKSIMKAWGDRCGNQLNAMSQETKMWNANDCADARRLRVPRHSQTKGMRVRQNTV